MTRKKQLTVPMRRRLALPLAIAASVAVSPARAEVPLTWSESGHPTVPALVDGRGPFQFVIGTSAEGSALFSGFAEEQGLRPAVDSAAGEGEEAAPAARPSARLATVELDGRIAHNIDAVILPGGDGRAPLPGVLGLDVIGRYAVEFDLPGGRVALHPAGTLPSRLGNDRMQPVQARRLRGGLLGLPVTINGAQGIALLDTGARASRINGLFAEAAGLAAQAEGEAPATPGTATAAVAVGTVRREKAALQIVDLPVFDAFGIAGRPAMILGTDLLQGVHMLVDFPWQTVWLAGPAEAGPEEPAPADTAPAEAPLAEPEPAGPEPAEAEPADTAPAPPADTDPLAGIEADIIAAAEAEAGATTSQGE